ncbi:MAG: acyltransferase family protein [Patescibacteria group bacterium]|nr:acyltransferase family protein [Patescibacteria group bacterium]MDD5716034.1 acyltransferase family protein [Patescibacteria group bacterium]
MNTQENIRRYDLDWLRVGVIAMLVPFHAAVMFDVGGEFFLKNGASSVFLAQFTDFVGAWGMQLLFFVAGASAWFMLRRHTWRQFIARRVLRLLVPLVVAIATVIPVMGYYGYRFATGERISFWRYYPTFFSLDGGDYTGYAGHFSPGHLWFVLFLLVLSLIALPIFMWFKSERGARLLSRVTTVLAKPGALFIVPFFLLLFDGVPDVVDRSAASFFLLLLFGFIWMTDQRLQERVDRQKYFLLAFALILGVVYTMLQAWGERQGGFTLGTIAFDLLHDMYAWTAILAFLALGHAFLNRPTRAVRYLGPASYPAYIIHLPIVISVGYYVIQWDAAVWLKFLVITIASYAGVALAYEFILRRISVLGRLFGVR